jgi:hypothetical protein
MSNNSKINNKNADLNIYVICEGTSCEFIQKSFQSVLPKKSSLSDYGIVESYYFNNNAKNVSLFDDSNSIYLVTTKNSCIESSFIMYGNNDEKRIIYPIPYTSNNKIIQSKGDIRGIKDEFGDNENVYDYLTQNKFSTFSDYFPNSDLILNWEYENTNSISNYNSINVSKFLELLEYIKSKKTNIKNVFLVTEAQFIISLINSVPSNRLTYKDAIEHSSMWLFKYKSSSGRLWRNKSILTSRRKLYPIGRNHGRLNELNNVYFYTYKNLRVPLFHYNKQIPLSYTSPKYLTLCKIIRSVSKSAFMNHSKTTSNKKINIERKHDSIKNELKKLKNNRLIS